MADDEDEKPKGTTIEIGGIKFTGGKVFAIITALSAAVGTLYGAFEVYKDYTDMKAQIQSYTAPDLSKYDQQMGVLGERMTSVERLAKLNSESLGYVTDNVTRNVNSAVQAVQAVDSRTRAIDQASTQTSQAVLNAIRAQDRETQQRLDDLKDANEKRLKELETGVDLKIQKTLANPLAGQ